MKMGTNSVVTLWIFLSHVIRKGECSEDKVFAFNGCNATLEWGLGNASFVNTFIATEIFNTSVSRIAQIEGGVCKIDTNVSIYCKKRNVGDYQLIQVVLISAASVNSGRYTCRIKYDLVQEPRNFIKELIVIEKPYIVKPSNTIVNDPLDITCTVEGNVTGMKYQWKLNGTDFRSTGRIYANSSILRFERLWTADKSNIFSCEVCEENNCCIESQAFAIEPYYGPDKVDLDHNEMDIYLHENDNFTIKCIVDCNPTCSLWWEGNINSNNEVLLINSFDSRMAGSYICVAKNLKTDKKAHSKTIFLHHAKDSSPEYNEVPSTIASSSEHIEGLDLKVFGTGLVISAVFLVIVGFSILFMLRRKYISRKSDSRTLHHPVKELENREVSRQSLSIDHHDIPLPIPNVQEGACRGIRSGYPCGNRKFRSLQTLFDHTKDSWNPVRNSLSLQTLLKLSSMIGRCSESDDSLGKTYYPNRYSLSNMEGVAVGIRLEAQYAKVRKDKKESNDEHNSGAKSLSINTHLPERFEQQSQ